MNLDRFLLAIDLEDRLVRGANAALDLWWLWPLLAGLLWLALKLRSQHALVGKLDERADAAFGDVDALLVERRTLITNLAEIVRAFAKQERDVLGDVLHARVDALEAVSGAGVRIENQVAASLQNLFTVSETFPDLACAQSYRTLREDLIRVEDRITAARRFYNLAVEELNAVRRSFPASLFAAQATPREKFSLGDRRAEFAEPVRISL